MIARSLLSMALILLPATLLWGCATGQPTKNLIDRVDEIAAKIDRAEMMGARVLSPRKLAEARVKLEQAIHEAEESHYPPDWVQAEFDKAEIAANELLASRSLAAPP
jgi:hypothetical protein